MLKIVALVSALCSAVAVLGPEPGAAADAAPPSEIPATVDQLTSRAEAGDPEAQFQLGRLYYYGRGVDVDHATAARWYLAAARNGHADAQSVMGYLFTVGIGVEGDQRQAAYWYGLAAEQGHPYAKTALAIRHQLGDGVPLDLQRSAQLYREAQAILRARAAQGDALAQFRLGVMYKHGEGVEVDLGLAAILLRAAALAGEPLALFELGEMYRVYPSDMTRYAGILPPPSPLPADATEAYRWYALAAARGYSRAVTMRDLMAEWMNPQERAAADAWVQAWRPSGPTSIQID